VVLSAVFATALSVAAFADALIEPWRVEPNAPAPITLRLPRTIMRTYDAESGTSKLRPVASVIARGSVVKDDSRAQLVRAFERSRRPPRLAHVVAQWTMYFVLVLIATAYMRRVSAKNAALLRTQVGLLGMGLAFLIGTKLLLLLTDLSPLLFPVALIPLWTSLYIDRRTGSMLAVVISLFAASLLLYDPIIGVVYLISSGIAALTFRAARKQSIFLVVSGVLSGAIGAGAYVATKEIFDGFSLGGELALAWQSGPLATLAAGTIAGFLAFFLQPLAARVLGNVSRAQLLNLTDLEQPLLRKMAAEAPGSWEHSRAMANLAEGAAAAIGADALLVRVGAYYHDLGKTCQCKYFVENLQRGERSPHEDLPPEVSADAIMAHVVEGTRILREGRVPEPVIEFAYTHHGTSVIEYFWHKCLACGNPKQLTEDAFRYPGMRPRTRETAILMLIDAIEAGARTVDPPTREKFQEMVQRVFFVKLNQGQLDESGLTVSDLRILASQITETLTSVYHKRIRYPWQDAKERGEEPLPMPTAPAVAAPPSAASSPESDPPAPLIEPSDTGKFRRMSARERADEASAVARAAHEGATAKSEADD
jgi:cyclic-di-AMP phosphodiesterase PgpH